MGKGLTKSEMEMLVSLITRTMAVTIQAATESAAVGELLVEKGIATQDELRSKIAEYQPALKKQLEELAKAAKRLLQ